MERVDIERGSPLGSPLCKTVLQISDDVPSGYRDSYGYCAKAFVVFCLGVQGTSVMWSELNAVLQCLNLIFAVGLTSHLYMPKKTAAREDQVPEEGHHIVLASHYKESQYIYRRLLQSVADSQKQAKWPVTLVIAAEEESTMMKEAWSVADRTCDGALDVRVAVHPRGVPGERPGLGSNLKQAIEYIVENEVGTEKTMVTKVDGNCWLPPDFLAQLEQAWSTQDTSLCFQTKVTEVDPQRCEYAELNWFLRSVARLSDVIDVLPVMFPLAGLHSSFCLPLKMICDSGNWDPWMIQEDNLAVQRAVIGTGGNVSVELLQSKVYNAPVLDMHDWFSQRERIVYHGWFALGYVLASSVRLWLTPRVALLFLLSNMVHLSLFILTFGAPLMATIGYSCGDLSWRWVVVGNTGSLLLVSNTVAVTEKGRKLESILTAPAVNFLQSAICFALTLKFLFVSESGERYKTTATSAGQEQPETVDP
eukprot:TRINITY_DN75979_c0_g1_i1.p1 TRINITY_DN75979_c0_g1~~TRINITY_DN75979_c0_g1_i1.p1  ORF type:complete len:477 (-),score=82.68 TRINITY_DN75979_c0_g1_i1:467-1897(-)